MQSKRTLTIGLIAATAMSGALAVGVGNAAAHPTMSHRAPSASAKAGAVTVSTQHKNLGTFLAAGRTLYLFEKDSKNNSRCNSRGCTSDWPPLIAHGVPKAGHGVKAHLLGTTRRKDGKEQVTYKGHPLYYFAGDTKKGQTHGEGLHEFGAEWEVIAPSGHGIDD